jgi:hypothetical protein
MKVLILIFICVLKSAYRFSKLKGGPHLEGGPGHLQIIHHKWVSAYFHMLLLHITMLRIAYLIYYTHGNTSTLFYVVSQTTLGECVLWILYLRIPQEQWAVPNEPRKGTLLLYPYLYLVPSLSMSIPM